MRASSIAGGRRTGSLWAPGTAHFLNDTTLNLVQVQTADGELQPRRPPWQAHSTTDGSCVPGSHGGVRPVRHVRFVVGHHGRIGRLALVTDSPVAATLATAAGHVVHPHVRPFGFTELAAAQAWAAGA